MKSPFLYAGGKYYARKYLDKHILNLDVYCEPFVGGGSIFFHKNKSRVNILNDLDDELIRTYTIIRDYPRDMIEQISKFDVPSKEAYLHYKNEYIANTEIEEASRWYYLNRTTYGGITCKTNMSYSYNDKYDMKVSKWGDIIIKASEMLQGVELRCQDAIECIETLPRDCFVFVDPPYINSSQKTLYKYSFELQDHYRLADTIERYKHILKFVITIDDNEIARDLYSFMPYIEDNDYVYTMNNFNSKYEKTLIEKDKQILSRKLGNEIIIRNF